MLATQQQRKGGAMRNSRLITFATVIATGFAIGAPTLAQAQQEFPTKPIRFMVGFVAGGSAG